MMARTCAYPLFRFTSVDPGRDGWNLYSYAASNPIKYVDPDGTVARALSAEAEAAILFIAGQDASAVSFAQDGTVSVNATADQLSANSGLAFLNDLVGAKETIGVTVGTKVNSASGDIPLTSVKSVRNLSATPDNRAGSAQKLPPNDFEGRVGVLSTYTATRTEKSASPRPISRDLVVFHELAENYYYKTVGGLQYEPAHLEAVALEQRLRAERPGLSSFAFGGGPFINSP
jgi:hypothetical protein